MPLISQRFYSRSSEETKLRGNDKHRFAWKKEVER